jgi:acyltransferase
VLGHSGFPFFVQKWIWSYHMPLFFFISGYLFTLQKEQPFSTFWSKKTRSLLIPYLCFTVLVILVSIMQPGETRAQVLSGVLLRGWGDVALWFLPVLYLTEMLFFFLRKISNKITLAALIIASSFIGLFLSLKIIHWPYKVEVVFISTFFFGSGYLLVSKINRYLTQLKLVTALIAILVLLFVNIIFCYANYTKLDLAYNIIGNYGYAVTAAFAGIFALLLVSTIIARYKGRLQDFLVYVGRNTLIILSVHQVLKVLLKAMFDKMNKSGVIFTTLRHIIFWILLFLLVEIINRYLYFLLGRTKPVTK